MANQRQKELIDKVRKFDAMKDKLTNPKAQKCNLLEIVHESLAIFEDRLEAKNIKVEINNICDENVDISFDRALFVNNVLNNIFSNAIKFSEHNTLISVSVFQKNNIIFLKIIDQGIGIPSDILSELFDGGVNNSRSGIDDEAGTGFGMGLIKETLDKFNCDIEVKSIEKSSSSKNHGTEITIKFPKEII